MDDEKAHPMWITLLPTICLLSLISSAGGVLCPNGCKCENEILRANCSGAGIEVVPIQLNPELHVMDLSNNKINQLHYTFTFYEKLYTLDVSRNRVKSLGSGNFKTQKALKFLNLSSNFIDSLGKDTFEGLVQLTELDLSNNLLETIGVYDFKDLNNLTILRMTGNQLDYFEEGTFKFTPNLQALYIDDNSFMEIPYELSDLSQLKVLSMARNLIESIEDDKVPNLSELQTLVLVQNQIYEIQQKGFSNMPKLDHLDLSNNNLTVLPTTQLSKMSKLVNLKLSGNTFNILPPVAFRGLFHLKYLTLARLEALETIDPRSFVDNINLEKISLDFNYKIKAFPTRLFHGNPKLRYVSIRYNSIKFLVASHFPLDQLEELRVGGNPLDCNCSMGWLWKILKDNELQITANLSQNQITKNDLKLDVNEVLCETPEELQNRKLVSATQRQMDCSMSWLAITSVSLTVIFILGIIVGVFFFIPKRKANRDMGSKELPKIVKTSYNAPPLPPPRKSLPNYDTNHVERYIMPPIVMQNRPLPVWDPYSQHCNGNGNIYEQLNDNRDRPHIVYV
ncbi:insulin-like growth factor-binding protein complex acid labile subunit [Euwallacea fornicatus]|uniref:insulin-like growth factor-binding protein complex acid labile subunit n=1 Tax=Euwallacea fornicatus TaxID=995702 RepID=UPI00338F0681